MATCLGMGEVFWVFSRTREENSSWNNYSVSLLCELTFSITDLITCLLSLRRNGYFEMLFLR